MPRWMVELTAFTGLAIVIACLPTSEPEVSVVNGPAYVICVSNGRTLYRGNVRDWREVGRGGWQLFVPNGGVKQLTGDCILNNPQP